MIRFITIFLLLFPLISPVAGQTIIPTKGKEFWVGFMQQYASRDGSERMELFITSDVSTSGVVSIPSQGYTQAFTVSANVTTTVTLPISQVEHTNSDAIDNKGIIIESNDTVSVFAINFKKYTADATKVYPYQSLGTDYRVSASYGGGYYSEFVIVATQDATQITITPSAATVGHAANTPFTINLSRGQSYQVKASSYISDLTGTTIKGTDVSGDCRPFAVFSGVTCVDIPANAGYCDHIYEQELPKKIWGKNYYLAPFSGASRYSWRVVADQNGTTLTINGSTTINLNAGQIYDKAGEVGAVCVSSNKPVSVVQYMEGSDVAGYGDPSSLILNAAEQKIDKVVFSTVQSTIITIHNANVIMQTPYTSQLTLDGAPVNPSLFKNFPSCAGYSYAQIPLSQGSHNFAADSGLIAYIYGVGDDESYAYSVGSYSKQAPVVPDTVYCTTSAVTLTTPKPLFGPWWANASAPNDTIGTGPSITVHPSSNQVYIVKGNSLVSGCLTEYRFSVEIPTPPVLTITASKNNVCQYEAVKLSAVITPPSSSYLYLWTPNVDIDNNTIPNPTITPSATRTYTCRVYTATGCSQQTASVTINVISGNVSKFKAVTDKTKFCVGSSAQLNVNVEKIVGRDDFNTGISSSLWSGVSLGTSSAACGSVSGNALYFDGTGLRSASTVDFNTIGGGSIRFDLKIGSGAAPCEDADPGEDIILEYSSNGGANWTIISTNLENAFSNFRTITVSIPAAAQTSATRFRWRQASNSGTGQDNWALDDVAISVSSPGLYSYTWSPAAGLSNPNIINPVATPANSVNYIVSMTDPSTGCLYKDSVSLDVGQLFSLSKSNDTTLCSTSGVRLNVSPSPAATYSYSWSPATGLSSPLIKNPLATPVSTTRYFVTVTSPQGCVKRDSILVTVNSLSSFSATPRADSLCLGQSSQLNVIIKKNCGTNASSCSGSTISGFIGQNISTTSYDAINPFSGASYLSSKKQYIYTKADLNAMGMTTGSTIQQIGFNISSGSGYTYQNFTIKMSCTSLSVFPGINFQSAVQVFNPKTIITSTGINYFVLDNYYDWDGASNIIVEVCYSNTSYNGYTYIYYNSLSSGSLYSSGTSVCANATGNIYSYRPDLYIKYCVTASPVLSYTWTPSAGLSNSSIANPVATPSVTTTYKVLARDLSSGCYFNDSVKVNVGAMFTLSAPDSVVKCSSGSVSINVTPSPAGSYTYKWSPASGLSNVNISNPSANPATSTLYKVKVVSAGGCIRRDSVKVILPNISSIAVTPKVDSLCLGQSSQLNTIVNRICGAGSSGCTNPSSSGSIGSGGLSTSSDAVTPLGNSPSCKKQILCTRAELNAAGLTGPSTISHLGFSFVSGSGVTYQNFTIKMSCTSLGSLTGTYITGLQTVFNPKNATASAGISYYTFDTPYDWDGSSNLIIELCYDNNGSYSITTPVVNYTGSSFNSVIYSISSGSICNATSGSVTTSRPNIYFKYCVPSNPFTYLWTPSATLNNSAIANPLASPSANTTYVLNFTDGRTGCQFKDSLRVLVAPDFSISTSGNKIKCGASVGISVSPGSPGSYTYAWTPASSLSGAGTSAPVANPAFTTTYNVKVVSAAGCIKRDSVKVTVPAISSISVSPKTDSLCLGSGSQLNTVINRICGTNSSSCGTTTNSGPVGTGAFSTSVEYISPFGSYPSNKKQILITKQELNASGINGPSVITSLGFNFATGTSSSYSGFSIKIACTSLTSVTNTYQTGLQTVFNPKTVTVAAGLNYYTFDKNYDWDGLSNIILEICYDNNGLFNVAPQVYYSITSFWSVCYTYSSVGVCNQISGSTNTARPNVYFKTCSSTANVSYLWTPASFLSNTAIPNPVATPVSLTTYTLNVTDNTSGCTFKDSLRILVGPVFAIDAGRDTTICKNASVRLNASVPAGGGYTIQWQPAAGLSNPAIANPVATPLATTTYKLTVRSSSGCIQKDSLTITLNGTAPVVTATAAKSLVCKGTPVQLNVLASGTACGTFSSPCASPSTGQIGFGSSTEWNVYASPYHGYANSSRRQFIFTKAELNAMGMTGGVISRIGFNVSGSMGYSYQGFTIKMGCTSSGSFTTSSFISGLSTVYNPKTITPVSGINYYVFDNNYDWDGSSNIVIELCFNNPTYPNYSQYVTYIVTTAAQAIYTSGSSVCASSTGSTTNYRPNVYFGYCAAGNSGNIIYSWSPTAGLSNPNITNPVATVNATTTYTVTATSGSCKSTGSVKVSADSSVVLKAFMDTTCTNGPVNLHAVVTGQAKPVTLTCGLSSYSACGSPSLYTVGTGTFTSNGYGPFYQNQSDFKGQYLITASDLSAAGMSTGIITRINFNVTSKLSSLPYSGFTVKMGCTSATNLSTAGWLSTSQVYGPQSYTTVAGLNTLNLTTPFNWDGTSNLVLEICWDNSSWSTGDYVAYTNTSYISSMINYSTVGSGCNFSPAYTYATRPNITFGICAPPPGVFTYSWTPSGTLSNATIANPVASPGVNTMYRVTVNGGACVIKDSVLAIPNQAVLVTVPPAMCKNDSVQLYATGGTLYNWTPSSGLSNAAIAAPKAFPSVNTTYVVNVKNALGCSKKDSVAVFVWNINPAKGPDQAICKGDSAQMNASGAGIYLWSPSAGLSNAGIASPKASPSSTTTYKVTYISSDGNCSAKDSIKIDVHNVPVLSITPNTTICRDDSLQLSAAGADNYQWTPATALSSAFVAAPKASPSSTIKYIVSGSSLFGCTSKDSLTVTVVNKPVLTITQDTMICKGQNLRLIVSGAQNYSWTPAAPDNDTIMVSPLSDTRYRVTGSLISGCSSKDSMLVQVHAAAVSSINAYNQDLCKGDSMQLNAAGAFNYSWSPAAGLSGTSGGSLRASPAITTKYVVNYSTSDGYCLSKDSVLISVHDKPVYSIIPDTTLCAGSSVSLYTNPDPGTVVNWSPGNFTGSSYPVIAGSSVKYTATLSNLFCQVKDSVMVTALPLPVLSLNAPATICKGDSIALGASGGLSYLWSPAAGLSNTGIPNPKAGPLSSVYYKAITRDANNCSDTDSVLITVIDRVSVSVSADRTDICEGDLVNLLATGAPNYSWSPSSGMSNPSGAATSVAVSQNTAFTVYGSNVCSIDSAKISIVTHDYPLSVPKSVVNICKGTAVPLAVNYDPAYSYSWNHSADLDNPNIFNPVATVNNSTDYVVTVTKGICSVKDTASVIVAPDQICVISPSSTEGGSPFQVSFRNDGTIPASYQWVFGDGDSSTAATPDHTFNIPGVYQVTLTMTDAAGCVVTNSVSIISSDFLIPNLITPNGDGRNDRFKISTYGSHWDVVIYNSWGSKVFEKEKYSDEWDGKGETDGIYYYHIFDRQTMKEYTGWVHLLGNQ